MTVTVPASDLQGTNLQGQITAINTLVSNNPNDLELGAQLTQIQYQLCEYLLSTGGLVPSQVLSNATYGGG